MIPDNPMKLPEWKQHAIAYVNDKLVGILFEIGIEPLEGEVENGIYRPEGEDFEITFGSDPLTGRIVLMRRDLYGNVNRTLGFVDGDIDYKEIHMRLAFFIAVNSDND